MGSIMPPNRVWKRTQANITLEPVEQVITEICEETSWTEDSIRQRLFESKMLIQIPGARYHIYRDSLG